ncbi:MAG: hypothetical protein IJT12_05285 [Paludibacteraceae bacterium]|nr:hypothetical protein [Paludibacteraceae bacterium]
MQKMVSRIVLMAVLMLLPLLAVADDAVLHRLLFRSGRVVVGEIVQRNSEVVIVKDGHGARFQYPMSDIQEITELSNQQPEVSTEPAETNSRSVTNVKRTSLGVRVAGGVMSLDGTTGGAVAADFRLGANNLGGRHIFLGGQVGYRGLIGAGKTLSLIPIDVTMDLPLMQGNHVPMLGANIGYGIGIGGIRGGVNAGLTLAYRYHFSRTGAFHIGIAAEVQQLSSAPHSITIDSDQTFLSTGGRTAVMGLLTLGVLF